MWKQIAVIFLLFAFAAQAFNQAIILLDYYTNSASFARNCENKARPMMHCNGKCQAMKKLKEEERKESQNPSRKSDNKEEVVCTTPPFVAPLFVATTQRIIYFSLYHTSFLKNIYADIFHPPAMA